MEIGLRLHKKKIKYESGKVLELTYQGYYVGEGFADLLVGVGADKIAVELKAVAQNMGKHEEQQLRNYMKVLKVKHGLLINFQHLSNSKSPKTPTELQIRNVSPATLTSHKGSFRHPCHPELPPSLYCRAH